MKRIPACRYCGDDKPERPHKECFVRTVSDIWHESPHTPNHPSYKAFTRETVEQYRAMIAAGVKVIQTSGTLTGSSVEMFARLDDSNELVIAIDGAPLESGHPLARWIPDLGLSVN